MGDGGKRLVYFCINKGESARRHVWSQVRMPELMVDMEAEGELRCFLVPEFYIGNQGWDAERLREVLQGRLDELEFDEFYLHPDIGSVLEIEERLPPRLLLQKVLKQTPCWEYVFLIGGEEDREEGCSFMREEMFREEKELAETLLETYLPRINHFTFVTDNPTDYTGFADRIYREYGIPAACISEMDKRRGKDKKTVILDGRRNYKPSFTMIPEEAVYVDLWSDAKKQNLLETKRKDVRYLSVVKFLDTLMENRYNTIVNQTYR